MDSYQVDQTGELKNILVKKSDGRNRRDKEEKRENKKDNKPK